MILADDLKARFDLIIDEVQTDQFLDSQVSNFLTMAQEAVFKNLWNADHPGEQPGMTGYFESSEKISKYLGPLIMPIGYIETTGNPNNAPLGHVPMSIVWEWPVGATISATPGPQISRVVVALSEVRIIFSDPNNPVSGNDLSVGNARFVPKNGIPISRELKWYAPNDCDPAWNWGDGYIFVYPSKRVSYFYAKALMYPEPIDIGAGVGSKFDIELANAIAFKAASLAGIPIRDTAFVQSVRSEIEQLGV